MEIKALLHRLTMIQRYSVYRVDYAFPYVYVYEVARLHRG